MTDMNAWVAKQRERGSMMTLEQARDKLADQQREIEDVRGGLKDWECVAHADRVGMVYLPTGREYKPTDHALTQMAAVGNMSSFALRSMAEAIPHRTKKDEDGNPVPIKGGNRGVRDYEVLRDYINIHLFNPGRVDQNKTRLFRTWKNGQFRALLSEQYQIVNNDWYMGVLANAMPEDTLVSHFRGDADTLHANIIFPNTMRDTDDGGLGSMLNIGNSEIGTHRLTLATSVIRAICMNGCIWSDKTADTLSKVHRGSAVDFEALAGRVRDSLTRQLSIMGQGVDRMIRLRDYGVGEVPRLNLLAQVSIDNSIPKSQLSAIVEGWGVEDDILGKDANTAYGFAAAITRAGQKFDNNTWLRFDELAGQMTAWSRDSWDRFRTRASNLSTDQIVKRVGQLAIGA